MEIKIGIVEDDPRTLSRFVSTIRSRANWSIAFACGKWHEARHAISQDSINVLLLDLGLPDGDGIDLIPWTLAHYPSCQVLIISVFGDEDNVIRCVEAGASGYLLKGQGDEELAEHLEDLMDGGSPMSPQIARRVLTQLRDYTTPNRFGNTTFEQKSSDSGSLLTSKEMLVLKDLTIGYTYGEVAELRQMSLNTVRHHVKSIYSKLYVNSRTQAINTATRMGILDLK
ncbi:response regulator transcription factor [Undibacterium baiyunense]|uniref:Response regulator transcription factor n=1 Tax=Undibacterium baiyunense TaxID=2828731 RepID=A0A941DFL6_9BURK|nr:response regulator transcription factor [Undibacterium baiyunense]MBR7747076.1 response regulator transcription factor [Undibacterium baiyunense]